jgi:hypothetical protein
MEKSEEGRTPVLSPNDETIRAAQLEETYNVFAEQVQEVSTTLLNVQKKLNDGHWSRTGKKSSRLLPRPEVEILGHCMQCKGRFGPGTLNPGLKVFQLLPENPKSDKQWYCSKCWSKWNGVPQDALEWPPMEEPVTEEIASSSNNRDGTVDITKQLLGNIMSTTPINLVPRLELENLHNKKIPKHDPIHVEETVAKTSTMPTDIKINWKRQLLPRSTSRPRLPRRKAEVNTCSLSDVDYSDNEDTEHSMVAERFGAERSMIQKAEQIEAEHWAQQVIGTKSKAKPATKPKLKLVKFQAEIDSPKLSDDTDETNIDQPRSKRLLPVDSSIDIASILDEFRATCWQDVWDARVRSTKTVHEDIQALMHKLMSAEHQHSWKTTNGVVVRGYTAERVKRWWKELQLISYKSASTYDDSVLQSLRLSKYQLQLMRKQDRQGKQRTY